MSTGLGKLTHTHIQNPGKKWVQVYDLNESFEVYRCFNASSENIEEHSKQSSIWLCGFKRLRILKSLSVSEKQQQRKQHYFKLINYIPSYLKLKLVYLVLARFELNWNFYYTKEHFFEYDYLLCLFESVRDFYLDYSRKTNWT